MLRFWFVIIISLPSIILYICKSYYIERHSDKYTESERYHVARRVVRILQHNGNIRTRVYVTDKLPWEGAYVMYPNHQGKYDALGIISGYAKPCDFMPDSFKCATRAKSPIVSVALIDSYKPFEINLLQQLVTQVHFLEPIYYDEYKNMTTEPIAEIVRERIVDTIHAQINS